MHARAASSLPLQKELAQFIEQEQAQARVQESVHKMTSMCWDKCVLLILRTRLRD